jgi:putative ABC transport system ATP-binding protein
LGDVQKGAGEMIGSIEVKELKHTFKLGKIDVPVLHGVNLQVEPGEFVALCGASGSGKSTLLNLIGGLTKPSNGHVFVNATDITNLNENQLCIFRQKNLGFIFQSYNLIPSLTALENVELTLIFAGLSVKERRKKAQEFLELAFLYLALRYLKLLKALQFFPWLNRNLVNLLLHLNQQLHIL